MTDVWTSKLGNVAKPLIIGLTNDDVLMTFSALSGPGGTGAPQLRMRLRNSDPSTAVSFDLVEFVDPDGLRNSQKIFTSADFDQLVAGTYIAEVDAHFGGQDLTFPDDGYIVMTFLRGID